VTAYCVWQSAKKLVGYYSGDKLAGVGYTTSKNQTRRLVRRKYRNFVPRLTSQRIILKVTEIKICEKNSFGTCFKWIDFMKKFTENFGRILQLKNKRSPLETEN